MAQKTVDITGQVFGYLTVIELDKTPRKTTRKYWICKCKCGNIVSVPGSRLRNGEIVSCGCKKREFKDITGQRFGRLVALERVMKDGKWKWKCLCDCGKICYVELSALGRSTNSCGCLHDESTREVNNRPDTYFKTHKGKLHPRYNPNLTMEEREKQRVSEDGYDSWRKQVKENANYTCDCCGKRGGNLHSHHLYSYSKYKHLRTDINNGVCLCEQCHRQFHNEFGNDNTKEQYQNFKNQRSK